MFDRSSFDADMSILDEFEDVGKFSSVSDVDGGDTVSGWSFIDVEGRVFAFGFLVIVGLIGGEFSRLVAVVDEDLTEFSLIMGERLRDHIGEFLDFLNFWWMR